MLSVSVQNKNGVSVLIDEADLGLLKQHRKGHWCFSVEGNGYVKLNHRKDLGGDGLRPVNLHRLIMNFPIGLQVNHINGNNLDNRKENLRLCTRSQSKMNAAGHGASKFKEVNENGKRWAARITTDGVLTHIGTFDTKIEAALAFDAAARLQGCKFRFLNFPDEVACA